MPPKKEIKSFRYVQATETEHHNDTGEDNRP